MTGPAHEGTALRALTSQAPRHCGVTNFVAALSNKVVRSEDYELLHLLPTHRSSIGQCIRLNLEECHGRNHRTMGQR